MERIARLSVKEYHDYQLSILSKPKPTQGGTQRRNSKGA